MSGTENFLSVILPKSRVRVQPSVNPRELRRMRRDLNRDLVEAVPAAVLAGLAADKWKMKLVAFGSDYGKPQTAPYPLDDDDTRKWADQRDSGGDPSKRSLYVALFCASSTELTSYKKHTQPELLNLLRYEVAKAFANMLLGHLPASSRHAGADYMPKVAARFRNAVWQDIHNYGGIDKFRNPGFLARNYGPFMPGTLDAERQYIRVFAEGLARIWGGGAWPSQNGYEFRFKHSLKVIGEINEKFCAADMSDPESRGNFGADLRKMFSVRDLYNANRASLTALLARRRVKKLPLLQAWMRSCDQNFLFTSAGYAIAAASLFFKRHPHALAYRNKDRVREYVEDYESTYKEINRRIGAGWIRGRDEARAVLREMTADLMPPGVNDMFKAELRAIKEVASRNRADKVLSSYLKCEKGFMANGYGNVMERLLLARALRSYADTYDNPPPRKQINMYKAYLDVRHKALAKADSIARSMYLDRKFSDDEPYVLMPALRDAIARERSDMDYEKGCLKGENGLPDFMKKKYLPAAKAA